MAQPIPLPAPLKGLNTLDPFIDFQSQYARELTNYSILNGRIKVRPRVTNSRLQGGSARACRWFDTLADSAIDTAGNIYTVTTGANTGSIGGTVQTNGTTVKHISLNLVVGLQAPRLAASPFTAWSFTTNTITATAITSACSYRGRMFVCDGTTIEYSPVGNVAGNMSSLSGGGAFGISAFMEGQAVIRMIPISGQSGNSADNYFSIFGADGKVLVYQGIYPGDPNWRIIGNFDMPPPASNVSFTKVDGDIFVATNQYPYWFSDLFQTGIGGAYEQTPGKPIYNLWNALRWTSGTNVAHCWFHQGLDAIICQCADYGDSGLALIADYRNASPSLVYFKKYDAWALWLMTPFFYPMIPTLGYQAVGYDGSIMSLQNDYMVDEWTSAQVRTEIDVETSWKTPFFYPQSGKNRLFAGVKPFFLNSDSGYLHLLRAITDLTDYNSPWGFYTQSTATQIPPRYYTDGQLDVDANPIVGAWADSTYTEFVGLGGDGGGTSIQFTQKRKSGTTIAQQQEIYTASISFDEGAAYPA